MPNIYLVSERTGPWPILSKEQRRLPRHGPVWVELVARTDDEAEAWETFECLVAGRAAPESCAAPTDR
jgi:hypothetical protein